MFISYQMRLQNYFFNVFVNSKNALSSKDTMKKSNLIEDDIDFLIFL